MKQRLIVAGPLLIVLAALAAAPVLASGHGVFLGLNAGIAPTVWSHNAYGLGVEAGFRFSERLVLGAEIGFGSATYRSSSVWEEESLESTAKTTSTVVPASLSLYYLTPVNDRSAFYIGLGAGHYSVSIKNETEERGSPYSQPQTTSETRAAGAVAPHACLGFEFGLFRNVALIGEVRYAAGKVRMSSTDAYGFTSEQDIPFGGGQIKLGLRIAFGGARRT